jgi:hypothetical protein
MFLKRINMTRTRTAAQILQHTIEMCLDATNHTSMWLNLISELGRSVPLCTKGSADDR